MKNEFTNVFEQNKDENIELNDKETKGEYAIVMLKNHNYILKIKDYNPYTKDKVILTLLDDTLLTIHWSNVIIFSKPSNIISSILESEEESFYEPSSTKHGKILMKKINKENPFKG